MVQDQAAVQVVERLAAATAEIVLEHETERLPLQTQDQVAAVRLETQAAQVVRLVTAVQVLSPFVIQTLTI